MSNYYHVGLKKNTEILLNRAKSFLLGDNPQRKVNNDIAIYEALNYFINKKYIGNEKNGTNQPEPERSADTQAASPTRA